MSDRTTIDLARFGGIVADNIVEFVDELRAIDLVDLVSYIRLESFPTVEDLVHSSTELFFKPGTLTFGWAAAADVRWDALPAITLGLEFRHPPVSLFFDLTIRDATSGVEVLGLSFDAPVADPVAQLGRAFAETRIPVGAASRLPLLRPVSLRRGARRDLPWG